jgi:hypothetical protein
MNWLLNLIGIMVYFINRYAGRENKKPDFSLRYWLQDNWPEISTVLLIDLAIMLLINSPGTEINFDEFLSKLPFGIKVAGDLFFSFLLGLGLASLFYTIFKKKVKDAKC